MDNQEFITRFEKGPVIICSQYYPQGLYLALSYTKCPFEVDCFQIKFFVIRRDDENYEWQEGDIILQHSNSVAGFLFYDS